MIADPRCLPLDWTLSPHEAVARWPRASLLACLWSAPPADPAAARWSRWTILAAPDPHAPHQRRARQEAFPGTFPGTALSTTEAASRHGRPPAPQHGLPPFQGGWIASLPYELGRSLEPAAASRTRRPLDDRAWGEEPHWLRCPAAYVHDDLTGRWWAVGEAEPRSVLPPLPDLEADLRNWNLGEPGGLAPADQTRYEEAVAATVEYIRAGDIFQANLTHRLSSAFEGDARAMFLELCERAGPWYGAYLELPEQRADGRRRAVLSASPELFLELDGASRRVVTRPIKGTRPADLPGAAAALERSEKDRAELTMIVDLMRNDIGRVCRIGSVRVVEDRTIERHGGDEGVWHGVATVEGVLRDDAGVDELLRATFPGGSITGAPKIRAMQIIEELEPVQRGPYTGSIGYISDSGHACFNIAIRTAVISGATACPEGQAVAVPPHHGAFSNATCDYGIGAGIIADSDPRAEWQETLDKAAPFLSLCRGTALAAAAGRDA